MTTFEERSYLGQVRLLRQVAAEALAHWPLEVQRFKLLVHGENTTFRVQSPGGDQYVLRVHRHGYQRPEAIDAELDWLEALGDDLGLVLPVPCLSREGARRVVVSHEGLDAPRSCVLFEWIEGRFVHGGLVPSQARQVGALLGRLHAWSLSHDLEPYRQRPRLVDQGMLGASWSRYLSHYPPALRSRGRALLEEMEEWHPSELLIHADLHSYNVLFRRDGLAPIDFDDCGFAPRLYDLAVACDALMQLEGRDALWGALLEGYLEEQSLSDIERAQLSRVCALRLLDLCSWLAERRDNPKLAEQADRYWQRVSQRIDDYLAIDVLGG